MVKRQTQPQERAVIVVTERKSKKAMSPKEEGIQEVGQLVTKHVDGTKLVFDKALPQAKSLISNGLQQLTACVAMQNLKPEQVRDVFDYSKGVEDAVKEAAGFARARVLEMAINTGEKTGVSGESRRLTFSDGRTILAKATRTGTDPKKFEQMLRAKAVEVTKYMVPDIKYKLPTDWDGPKQAIDDGVFTEDEVTNMAYETGYSVERSKEGKNE